MRTQDADDLLLDGGLCTIEAEFLTSELRMRARVISPEPRLSDHLNSATTLLEVQPSRVQRLGRGPIMDVSGHPAYLTKAHLLAVIPLAEPSAPDAAAATVWRGTVSRTCWAVFAGHSVVGRIHMDADRDPRLFLRSLEQRQFVPLTDVHLTFPDGAIRDLGAIVVNRFQLHLLVLDGPAQ